MVKGWAKLLASRMVPGEPGVWLVSGLGLGVESVMGFRVPVVVVGVLLGEPLAKRVLEFLSVSVGGEVGLLEGCCPG